MFSINSILFDSCYSLVFGLENWLQSQNPLWYAWAENEEVFCVSLKGDTKDFHFTHLDLCEEWINNLLNQ